MATVQSNTVRRASKPAPIPAKAVPAPKAPQKNAKGAEKIVEVKKVVEVKDKDKKASVKAKDTKSSPAPQKSAAKKPEVKKEAAKVSSQILAHKKDTAGTYAYAAVGTKGQPLDVPETSVPQLYIRKAKFKGKKFVVCTVQEFDNLKDAVAAMGGKVVESSPDEDSDDEEI